MTVAEIQLDISRLKRIGLEEAIYAESKSLEQLSSILIDVERRDTTLLITRLDEAKFAQLPAHHLLRLDYCPVSRTAYFGAPRSILTRSEVAIVAAGTSDIHVAREAERTLRYHGHISRMIVDVGVAGLWRLTRQIEQIQDSSVVIVVAGMDAALPSVVGGLLASVLIAVPTSVGYGVTAGGHTALHAALSSCAPGITVVNIDNGYGAACAALRVLNALARPQGDHSTS